MGAEAGLVQLFTRDQNGEKIIHCSSFMMVTFVCVYMYTQSDSTDLDVGDLKLEPSLLPTYPRNCPFICTKLSHIECVITIHTQTVWMMGTIQPTSSLAVHRYMSMMAADSWLADSWLADSWLADSWLLLTHQVHG